MHVFYRISNNSFSKQKIFNGDKQKCLNNFLSVFAEYKDNITIIADNANEETIKYLQSLKLKNSVHYTNLGNANSFIYQLDYAIETINNPDEIVYFVEDDYLHLPISPQLIIEGLERAAYISLYDHPDKYINKDSGGNPFVEYGGEVTRVILTKSSHWKLTNSTTMTFATKIKTVQKDLPIFNKYVQNQVVPHDFELWRDLIGIIGRALITPIPGASTHIETKFLTPLINWSEI